MADSRVSEFPSVTSVAGTEEILCVQDSDNKTLTPDQLKTYVHIAPVVITATTDSVPTLGAELLATSGWTVGSGWAESPDDTFSHTSGTAMLTHSASIVQDEFYFLEYTITNRTAGTIVISFGGTYTESVSSATNQQFVGYAENTNFFTVTPSTDFNGTITCSLKLLTYVEDNAVVNFKESNGDSICHINYSYPGSFHIGQYAGCYDYNKDRVYNNYGRNTSLGYCALRSCGPAGYGNTAVGFYTLEGLQNGHYNTVLGSYAGSNLGYNSKYNTAVGTRSQANVAGYGNRDGNSSLGYHSLYSLMTGNYNCALGYFAGCYHANGSTALTDPEYSIYIGYNARGKDNDDNNSIVIGKDAIGLGANTTVLGNSSTTLTRLFGDIATGTDTSSAAIHAIKTTEQLRLGYDANNYVAHTVDSSGNVLIDAVGVVKIGGSTNYSQIGTDGTITLVGTATAFDDLLIEMKESLKGSGTKPDWDATNLGFLFPQNNVTEIIYLNVQLPHRWKEGSTIYPHIHFFQDQNVTPTFKLDYRWVNIGDSVPSFTTGYTMNSIVGEQTWTTGLLHRVVTNTGGLSGSGKSFSSMLQIKLYRDDNTYSGDCLVTSFDIHYEIDSFGTSSEYQK